MELGGPAALEVRDRHGEAGARGLVAGGGWLKTRKGPGIHAFMARSEFLKTCRLEDLSAPREA
jgi:hypothetical protein